jgi:hypothetical protein
MVCQVKFTGTRDDRLRQPVFLGIREDKDASEAFTYCFYQTEKTRRSGEDFTRKNKFTDNHENAEKCR